MHSIIFSSISGRNQRLNRIIFGLTPSHYFHSIAKLTVIQHSSQWQVMDDTKPNQPNESNDDNSSWNTPNPQWSFLDFVSKIARGEGNTPAPPSQSDLMTTAQAFQLFQLAGQMAQAG
ncbi:hypothetical protein MMC22_003432 [Lobaria immixta]|nr:hypothetical protein [Lobaria immixta]